MSLPLTGEVAIITGSSRSIGAAIATRLVSQDANVVVINYVANAAAAQKVADAINAKGEGCRQCHHRQVKADVADNKRLVEETLSKLGRIDILVLNAGKNKNEPLQGVTEETFDMQFDTNVKSPFFLVQTAAPHIKAGGRIIFFSGSLAHLSTIPPHYLVYASTKGAVEQLPRVLAKQLGLKGINVNTVGPGPIDTDMFRAGKMEKQIKYFAGQYPQKRLGNPEEVSNLVAFLVSEEASWVNGQTLLVNGGFVV